MTISMSCRPNQLIFCQFLTGNCKSLDSLKITDLLLHRHLIAAVNSAAKEIRRNYSKKVFPLHHILLQNSQICCNQVSDKLISLIRATLRLLAKHFNSVVGEALIQEIKMDFEDQQECGNIVFILNTFLILPDVEVKLSIDEVQDKNKTGKVTILFLDTNKCL